MRDMIEMKIQQDLERIAESVRSASKMVRLSENAKESVFVRAEINAIINWAETLKLYLGTTKENKNCPFCGESPERIDPDLDSVRCSNIDCDLHDCEITESYWMNRSFQ
jgi:hypothetical protein